MTVRELRAQLEAFPEDAEVTDVRDIPITKIAYEPGDDEFEYGNVWLDTD